MNNGFWGDLCSLKLRQECQELSSIYIAFKTQESLLAESKLRLAVCIADVVARCPAVTLGRLQVLGFRPWALAHRLQGKGRPETACLQRMPFCLSKAVCDGLRRRHLVRPEAVEKQT